VDKLITSTVGMMGDDCSKSESQIGGTSTEAVVWPNFRHNARVCLEGLTKGMNNHVCVSGPRFEHVRSVTG
jgi:hypothetical protein